MGKTQPAGPGFALTPARDGVRPGGAEAPDGPAPAPAGGKTTQHLAVQSVPKTVPVCG